MKRTVKYFLLLTILILCFAFLCSCQNTDSSESFWDTYYVWIIISAIVVFAASTIYIIVMIINDLDVSDLFDAISDFFEDNSWVVILLFFSIGGGIWAIIQSYWVQVLIIVLAIVAFLLIAAIAHFIKHIVEDSSYYGCSLTGDDFVDDDSEDDDDEFDEDELEEDNVSVFAEKKSRTTIKKSKKTDSLAELNSLIGLESVKEQIRRIRAVLLKNKDSTEQHNLHMCFYGNPGTGKTVVARQMANIFYEVGALPTNKLVETDRSGLCGQYLGQTAPRTHKKVKEAMGGVLFIDEAYTLNSKDDDYGKEAIAALLKDMEDYKGKVCVILAGYKDEMENMIALNPGFDSRINRKIIFPDYTVDEQMQIFDIMLSKNKYEISENAKAKLMEIFEQKSKSKHFANARTVRNILDNLIEIQAVRTMDDMKNENERIIKINDVVQYIQENEDN